MTAAPARGPRKGAGIVASSPLVSERAAELSEFEYGLVLASNAFQRWIVRCMAAAGAEELGSLEVQVLHNLNHQNRERKLADICFVLNIEDSHTVNYALKKLLKLGLIASERRGKEVFYATTAEGRALCARYREVRERCLVTALEIFAGEAGPNGDRDLKQQIGGTADLLRALSGLYDQAARAATSL